jgi:AraC-like DNA-binding protein
MGRTKRRESATVSVVVIIPLLKAVERAGCDVDQLLTRVGISPSILENRDSRIEYDALIETWRLAYDMIGDPALGIRAAKDIVAGVFGVIDYVTSCSRTLGEGIVRSCRYYPLIHDVARPTLKQKGDVSIWAYNLIGGYQYPRFVAEYALACWLILARQGLQTRFDPVEVQFIHNQTVNLKEYERFFRAPVKLGAERNALVIKTSSLKLPLVGAKEGLCEILDKYARQLMKQVPKKKSLSERVRELMAEELAGGDASAEGIATRLHMSTRTLRRRLNEEGNSHRLLLEELRRNLAELYLDEKGLAVSEAAFLLGFADSGAFHKAFKRWTGRTPAEYRKSAS